MAITKFTEDMDIIAALGNRPNIDNGLSADQLKAKFDLAGKKIQDYINNTLVDEIIANVGAPLMAATAAAMTDTDRIYVYTGSETGYTAGNWYFYNGSAWTSGGVYNAVAVETDKTLSLPDVPADAAVTGELGDKIERVYVTRGINVTNSGVTIKENGGNLIIYGTTTATRTVRCLNGQNSLATTSTAFAKTIPAGKYEVTLTATGSYPSSAKLAFTYSTFGSIYKTVDPNTPTIVELASPAMVGLRVVINDNFGTEANPSVFTFSIKERSANDKAAREALAVQGYASPWYDGIDLTLKFAAQIAASPYNGDPWAWIKARVDAENFDDLHIGDYIPLTTTGGTLLHAQIAGINTYKGYGDTEIGNHIDFICRELWPTNHAMNPVNLNNGTKFGDNAATEFPWLASDLYLYLNSLAGTVASAATVGGGEGTANDYTSGGVYYALPSALQSVIAEKLAYIPKRYSADGLLTDDNGGGWTNIGKLWLPTETEVYGAPCWGGMGGYATLGTNIQYPLFAHNAKRAKASGGTHYNGWLLSAASGNTTKWCFVASSGVASSTSATNTGTKPLVCFRIA